VIKNNEARSALAAITSFISFAASLNNFSALKQTFSNTKIL